MPLYSLDIQKQMSGEYFTNRYVLQGATIPSLYTTALAIWQAEQAIMLTQVQFVSYRISDYIAGNDQYVVVPIGQPGLRVGGGEALPLFCCARVDFSVELGRPSRKYLRGVLTEGDQSNFGVIAPATLNFIDVNYTEYVYGRPEFVDVDGQEITFGRAISQVAMRQLRRGSRRRLTPIIPVS